MTDDLKSWRDLQDAPTFEILELAFHAILAKKGEDIVVLDLRGISDVADFYVIVTGNSEPQVDTISRALLDELLAAGFKPHHQEGRETSQWVLLDYFDMVVHVMTPRARIYYRLEELWNDAGRLEIKSDYFDDPGVAERHPDLQLVRLAAGRETPAAEDES